MTASDTRSTTSWSDFVYPAWFESFRESGSTRFDHMNQIQNALQLLKGGYIGTFNGGWQQQTAEKHPSNLKHRGNVGTRRERSATPRDQWVTSLLQRRMVSNAQQFRQNLQTIRHRSAAA